MLRLVADENFNGDIIRGLLRRNPKLDIVRVQDVGLSGADDTSVLQWAADARGFRGKVRFPCRTGYRRFDSPDRMQLRWRMGRAGPIPSVVVSAAQNGQDLDWGVSVTTETRNRSGEHPISEPPPGDEEILARSERTKRRYQIPPAADAGRSVPASAKWRS
jgi:hypothetical protein